MTRVLCIGAAHWDVIGCAAATAARGDDLPGSVRRRPGGVAVNVARALLRAGLRPQMLTALGADAPGDELIAALRADGVGMDFAHRMTDRPTGTYVAVEDPSGLVAAVADTGALDAAGAAILRALRDGSLASAAQPFAGAAVIDGNLSPELLAAVADEPGLRGADLRIVPASPAKAARLLPLLGRTDACLCLNRAEAEALCGGAALPDAARAVEAVLALGARRVIVTDGPRAAAEASLGQPPVSATPPAVARLDHVTGAGDTTLATHLAAELAGADRQTALLRAVTAGAAHVSGTATGA